VKREREAGGTGRQERDEEARCIFSDGFAAAEGREILLFFGRV